MTNELRIALAIGVGVGATIFIDAWNLLLKQALGIPSLSNCLLGRWVLHMPSGVFRHRAIGSAAEKRLECVFGLVTHYLIGITLAAVFVVVIAPQWLARPTLGPALSYGIATVLMPYFVMQPALGLGVASAAARRPTQARLKSLATHTMYGVGMYIMARAAAWLIAK